MKKILQSAAVLLLLSTINSQLSTSYAQGTAFTYQGRLNDGVNPANGRYDVRFALYDAASAGLLQGNLLTNTATAVSNGLFTVTLDFGNQFPGANRWLELAVRTNGSGAFSALTPRQPLTPTPYAVYASTAGSAVTAASASSVAAANITGALTTIQLPANVVTNGASGVNISGTFSGNGVGVTNINLAANSGGAISWLGNFALNSAPFLFDAPNAVVVADVNGDGKPDLISASSGANALTVLTNNGSGGFGNYVHLTVGGSPLSLTTTDVNGDGKVDLITANYGANTLTVLTNTGSGFGIASSLGVGSLPRSVSGADVNGDGKVDLISANSGDSTLTVLTNTGSGGFVLSSSPGVNSLGPVSVQPADINGDGKVDLISANISSDNLTILTNIGNGSFFIASRPSVGGSPLSVIVTELNGDGKVDLVSANNSDNTLTILTNNGNGSFLLSSSYGVGLAPVSLSAADVNGDGKLDLISANQNALTLSILTNNGSGSFSVASSPNLANTPYSLAAADVNGDGHVDLVVATQNAFTLSVLFNTPTFSGNFGGSFTGNGAGLSSLSAVNLVGLIPSASLGSVPAANLFGSVPSGALTSVPAASLTGTIVDARLSANVALRAGGNTFSGNQTINGSVGIGTTSPAQLLQVGDSTVPNSQGMMRFASRSGTGGAYRNWDVGVPETDEVLNGIGYSFVIDDPLNTGPEMIIKYDTGNVGIGVTNPATKLQVGGVISAAASSSEPFEASGAASGYALLDRTTGAAGRWVMFATGGTLGFYSGGNTRMSVSAGGTVTATAFNPPSDRNLKENFVPVSPQEVLEKVAGLPISRWNFKEDKATPHVGPMAQDFHAAFGLGTDDRHIATVDADGVALAAIQGLNQKLEAQQAENAKLKARLEKLEKLLLEKK
jgi:hypothetical protein